MFNKGKSKLGFLIMAGICVYFGYVAVDQQKVIVSKNAEKKSIEAKIEDEKKKNDELKKQKEILDTDEYTEKTAREQLGMVKPGEKIFVDVNK